MATRNKYVSNINSISKNIFENKTYKYKDLIVIPQSINEFKGVANFKDIPNVSESNRSRIIEIEKQKDLAYGNCIYVSEGSNKNGAFFLRQELIKARKTPILKPVDIEHNPDIIVGAIYDSTLVTQTGKVINDSDINFDIENNLYRILNNKGEEVNDKLDIKISFVIYKYMFPAVTNEISKYQFNDINKKYFVSMEVFYNDFGYVFDRDESTFIKVEDNLAGKELIHRYGEYVNKIAPDGRHVSIAYLDYIFSAVGITEKPANKRSYLLDLATNKQDNNSVIIVDDDVKGIGIHTHTNLNKGKSSQEEEMLNKEIQDAIEKAVNKAMASNPDLSADEARTGVLEARIEILANDNSNLLNKLDTANDKMAIMSKEVESISTEFSTKEETYGSDIASKESEIERLSKELAVANESLTTIKQEKLGVDRIMELETAGIKFGDRREGVVSRVSKMTDKDYSAYKEDLTAMFASILSQPDDKKGLATEDEKNIEDIKDKKDINNKNDGEDKKGEGNEKKDKDIANNIGVPDLSIDTASAAEFNSATASVSKASLNKDYNVLIQGAFKQITTRTKDRKRGDNTIF